MRTLEELYRWDPARRKTAELSNLEKAWGGYSSFNPRRSSEDEDCECNGGDNPCECEGKE